MCFWVRDTGSGIPQADRERVFQRFVRAGGPRAEGAGLGLSIVAAIAHAHGGDVTVADTPGGGATIEIRLPHCGADVEAASATKEAH